jgi:hypothetical protein
MYLPHEKFATIAKNLEFSELLKILVACLNKEALPVTEDEKLYYIELLAQSSKRKD